MFIPNIRIKHNNMKENNKKVILSRRDFFKLGISKTIPVLVSVSIPSVLISCNPDAILR